MLYYQTPDFLFCAVGLTYEGRLLRVSYRHRRPFGQKQVLAHSNICVPLGEQEWQRATEEADLSLGLVVNSCAVERQLWWHSGHVIEMGFLTSHRGYTGFLLKAAQFSEGSHRPAVTVQTPVFECGLYLEDYPQVQQFLDYLQHTYGVNQHGHYLETALVD